ncbi:hypothetical protein CMT41_16060 [Colwellia sp. MT41]|nr:hypothetical protein CMT41_16060 [Colwellia sp. MT41]
MVMVMTAPISLAADIDPTRPFGVSGSGTNHQLKRDGGFLLSSIIHGDGIHTAVINGKIYSMFDYVGEYRITAINSHSVILRSKTKRLKINIFKKTGFKSKVIENTVIN